MSLPSGYTQLEWIESTGTQYIDTGYTPNNNTRVVAEVETTTSISSNKWIFGQRSNSNTQRYEVIYIASANAIRFYINTSNYTFAGVGLGRLSIDVSATSATINGVSVSPSVSDFNGARSIYICDCNSNATSDEAIKQKVYSFQIYDNGTLVRDFVPARRNSDITVGLFDRANDVFYVNSGTGAFGAGPVAEGPDYIKLEYIEASGSQYIDSLVSGVLPVRVVLKMRSGTGMATTDSVMVGMYQSGKMTTPVYLYQGTWFISCGNSDGASAIGTLVDNKDYEVVSELTPTYFKCTVNGTVVINKTANSTGGANTLYLFARNDSGTATRFASGRMYSCQIYSGTTLVRDFIPARRNSDGAVGLLDQANNVFYGNAGTGTFTAGPEVSYTWLEWIESSGTQWIDTGFVPNGNTRTVCDFQMMADFTSSAAVFGARTSGTALLYVLYHIGDNAFRHDYYGSFPSESVTDDRARMIVDKNKNITTLDGQTITSDASTASTGYPMMLFAVNYGGVANSPSKARIYSCQIYDNGTMVRDYVPAKRSDGTVGLYDKINERFYTNSGTGAFTAGPEIVESASTSMTAVDGTEVLLTGCLANVGGVEHVISYALANIDGIEVVIPLGEMLSSTIAFYVQAKPGSDEYLMLEAEPGMTWRVWIDSEYNVADGSLYGDKWVMIVNGYFVYYQGIGVDADDEIQEDGQYTVDY